MAELPTYATLWVTSTGGNMLAFCVTCAPVSGGAFFMLSLTAQSLCGM
jgi:hypothetical protein